ncbi:MAG: carbohydrate binding family 9 domain-containing protein, partial [Flavobacteriaceae bacterium]
MGNYFGLKFLIFQACLGIFLANIVLAQAPKRIEAKYIEKEINIDGNLNEEVWDSATEEGNFMQFFPTDSLPAKYQTTFKVIYSQTTLYVGVKAFTEHNDHVVSSLKRDFNALANDNISLLFDTFSDGTTAFFFGVTPYGVRREGLVSD